MTWTSIGTRGGVTIELFSSGVYSSTIVSWTIDSGSYDWFVPVLSSGTYQIFIKDAAIPILMGPVCHSLFPLSLL